MKFSLTWLPSRSAVPIVPEKVSVLLLAQKMCCPSTAIPAGPSAPVMKLWSTSLPSRFALPIVFEL
jgi:hypothetical protein